MRVNIFMIGEYFSRGYVVPIVFAVGTAIFASGCGTCKCQRTSPPPRVYKHGNVLEWEAAEDAKTKLRQDAAWKV